MLHCWPGNTLVISTMFFFNWSQNDFARIAWLAKLLFSPRQPLHCHCQCLSVRLNINILKKRHKIFWRQATFLNLTWHVDEGTLNIFSFFAFWKYEVFHIQRWSLCCVLAIYVDWHILSVLTAPFTLYYFIIHILMIFRKSSKSWVLYRSVSKKPSRATVMF